MYRSGKGFTMMELMVVMAIMGGLMALVGPALMNSYQKMQVQSETRKLRQSLSKVSYKAFLAGKPITIELTASTLKYFYTSEPQKKHSQQYQHIYFETQTLAINANGFIDNTHVEYTADEKLQRLSLEELNNL
jgi:prepilin-type N-terminal cleavage/methylation domain-containing protein